MVAPLTALNGRLAALDPWSDASIHAAMEAVCAQSDLKFGKLAQPVRVAVTGATVSPSIDVTLRLIGRQRSVARIERAIAAMAAGDPS